MALLDKETICAEIKRRYAEYSAKARTDDTAYYAGMADAIDLFEQYIDTLPEQPELKPKAIVIRSAVNLQKELMEVSAEVKDAVMLLLKDGWSLKAPDSEREFDQRAVCAGFSSIPPSYKLDVKPEQSVEGMDAEIERYWNRVTGFQPSFAVLELTKEDLAKVARNFYELGCTRAAVMYDDIEYERQRAEEAELSGDLEEEIETEADKTFFANGWYEGDHHQPRLDISLEEFRDIARHFAEWGAEHVNIRESLAFNFIHYLDEHRPDRKMCLSNGECADIVKAFESTDWDKILRYANKFHPQELDDAAEQFIGNYPDIENLREYEIGIISFKAGAGWGKKQVLQEIYDGKVKPADKITAAWLADEQDT